MPAGMYTMAWKKITQPATINTADARTHGAVGRPSRNCGSSRRQASQPVSPNSPKAQRNHTAVSGAAPAACTKMPTVPSSILPAIKGRAPLWLRCWLRACASPLVAGVGLGRDDMAPVWRW